jgi:hypothetical protein
MSSLAVLVHSFDKYSFLWPGYKEAFDKHWCLRYPELYFGSDIETENKVGEPFQMLYSGHGEWSDRLRTLLSKIPHEYVFYSQEDHWPTRKPPLIECWRLMLRLGLDRLQISPVNQYYTLAGAEIPLNFHPTSKYLVSHQPSIWRKDFLLSCLRPEETPWENEYKGTKRLNGKPVKIAIYPYNWYDHKCVKGKMV